MPARLLPALQIVAALLATGLAYVATQNMFIAVLLATLGWYMPLSLLQSLAGRIWNQVDDQAHTLANILQFALPVQGNPYVALRSALPDIAQPFQDWMRQVVAGETAEVPMEDESAADPGAQDGPKSQDHCAVVGARRGPPTGGG